jgi:hypothetical protein
MKNKPLEENFSELSEVLKSYLDARFELWKALFLEKFSKIGTYFFSVTVLIMMAASLLLLLTFAFSFWFGSAYGKIYEGFLISAGFYLIVGVVIYLLRKPVFSNPIIRSIGKVLLSKDEDEDI